MNKTISYSMIAMLGIMLVGLASAATTLVAPATSSLHSTTIAFNCTTAITVPQNVTIYYSATGGTPSTVLSVITNSTGAVDDTMFNATVSVTSLADGASYSFACMATNGTTSENSTAKTSITIDDTNPAIAVQLDSLEATAVIQYKCTDNVDTSPTATMTLPDSTSATLTGGSSDFIAFTNTVTAGTYTITCTDDLSHAVTQAITVSESGRAQVDANTNTTKSNKMLYIIIGAIALIWFLNRD